MMQKVPLPVMVRTRVERERNAIFYIPEIFGHWHPYVEREINWHMYDAVRRLAKQQCKEQDVEDFSEMISTYEIKTNERNVLSVTFTNYAYAEGHAHGLTLMDALTFDVITGKRYHLNELFKPHANYVDVLTRKVNEQIKERDIPTLKNKVSVNRRQPFYIADLSLVLFYPLYAITPYYYGIPRFPISVFELQAIVDNKSPLGRMLPT